MGIGHFAVGLALKKAEPRINVGPVILAAYFSDFLLGIFVWLGLEQYHVPADVATKHYLTFTFPYSHSLTATLMWAFLAGLAAYAFSGDISWRKRSFWIVVAAVCSHFVLDVLVHVVGLPILGDDSYKLGLGLWNHLPIELGLEVVITAIGLAIYLRCTQGRSVLDRFGIVGLLLLITPIMVAGQATMTAVPPRSGLIATWIFSPILLAGTAFWLDRKRRPADIMKAA
jgi:hypothetical protein